MVEIVDIASFHPDVIPHGRKRCCIRIRIGGATIHGILLVPVQLKGNEMHRTEFPPVRLVRS